MRWSVPLMLCVLLLPGAALADECKPGSWRLAAPLPASRTEVVAASDGQAVYVAGGMANDAAADLVTVFRYDVAANRWAELTRLDKPVNHAGLAVIGDKLYVIGGYEDPGNRPTARLRVIDRSSGELTDAAPMPAARGALAAVVLDGRIHVLGGTTDRTVATHEIYDPATDRWSEAAPMRVARNHLAAAVLGGRIFAFGGRDERTFLLDAAEVFDPATGQWADIAPLPTGRSGIGTAVSGGRIVVVGGEQAGAGGRTFAEAEAYDPATNSWTALAPMPTARHGLGVAAAGDDIVVVSGGPEPGLTVSDVNEVLCGPLG